MKNYRWKFRRQLDAVEKQITKQLEVIVINSKPYETEHIELFIEFCELVARLDDCRKTILILRDKI